MPEVNIAKMFSGKPFTGADGLRRRITQQGYVKIYLPDHPRASGGYVFEHIVVLEQKLGRPVYPDTVVHHINGCTWDNRPENLELRKKLNHWSHHMYQKMLRDWNYGHNRRNPVKTYNLQDKKEGYHMSNSVTLSGRLAADPAISYTKAGKAIAKFRLAGDTGVKPREGQPNEPVWVNVIAWEAVAEAAANTYHKGQLVELTGRLGINQWTDKAGQKRSTPEITAYSIKPVSYAPKSDPVDTAKQVFEGNDLGDLNLDDLPV